MSSKTLKKSKEILSLINRELNIDLEKYKNEEVISKVGSIFNIQFYAISRLIRPIFVGLLCYVAGFFLLDIHVTGYIFYGIFGFVLFILASLTFGVNRILHHLRKDLTSVVHYGIETFDHAVNDLTTVNSLASEKLSNKDTLNLLFEGFMVGLISPEITKKVQPIPIVGNLVDRGVSVGMTSVVSTFRKQGYQLNVNTDKNGGKVVSFADTARNKTNAVLKAVDKTLNSTLGAVQIPFKISFYLVSFILIVFLSIIHFS